MTREEAKKWLYKLMYETKIKELKESLDMAISAHEQEPCETSTDEPMTMVYPTIICDDAISREAVLLFIEKVKESGIANYGSLLDIATEVRNLPSVQPSRKGHWIYDDECKEHGHCDKCGFKTDLVDGEPHNFCPKCGACMKDGRTLDEFIEDMRGDTE